MNRANRGTPSHVDLRGFQYALEPLQRKHDWELDALRARLARKVRAISEAQTALKQLDGRYRAQTEEVARATRERLNPVAHRQGLIFLMQLQERIRDAQAQLLSLRADKDALQEQCIEQQQKLELLAEHRQDSLHAYASDQATRQANEADSEWIARQHWRAGQASDTREASE